MIGNMVRPGDLVICPSLRGKSAELRTGVVEEVNPGSITVKRVTQVYNYKNKSYGFGARRWTTGSDSVVVLRWDFLSKDSKYYDYLIELRDNIMKQ